MRLALTRSPFVLVVAALLAGAAPTLAQPGGAPPAPEKLVRITAAPVALAAGQTAETSVRLEIEDGWHINANPASPDYMIATALEMAAGFGIKPGRVGYPAPRSLKVDFEEAPLLVFDGSATLRLSLAAAANAVNGAHTLKGKLRFQACNDQVCLAPVSLPVEIAVTVTGGTSGGTPVGGASDGSAPGASDASEDSLAAADSVGASAGPGAAADTAGGKLATHAGAAGSAALDNPLARALDRGGLGAFLTLFLIGLALNLTPCVYPMLGVTVSIFGARRAAPPLQVFGYAVLYVLGMAIMYSGLGLAAAFTGGLFGGMLQNPLVLVGIGVLLIALALSMFGLYELTLPPALLSRLGGNTATSAMGTFLSGLMVGIFAAPCIGPPVVALLALVGAKGDPWFGFTSFFTLAMGLGAPYLVLATFSNLIQALPRSGDWMVWVKKVFGVILVALGLFYASLALAPDLGVWIAPAALILGGLYLGFFEKSAEKKPGFRWLKRLSGAAATLGGVVLVVTAPTQTIAFEPYTDAALQSALASGQPAMLDFTANWCAPCHELERLTFTDGRVREAARAFRTFRVDLTRYDSPEAERWRRDYAITGVPTVLFVTPEGAEVRAARVEGFLPPAPFLERMKLAVEAGQRASSE